MLVSIEPKGQLMATRGGFETRCFETRTRRDFVIARPRRDKILRNRDDRRLWIPANNAMQGPCRPYEGCPYGTRTDLAAGAVVAQHELSAWV